MTYHSYGPQKMPITNSDCRVTVYVMQVIVIVAATPITYIADTNITITNQVLYKYYYKRYVQWYGAPASRYRQNIKQHEATNKSIKQGQILKIAF